MNKKILITILIIILLIGALTIFLLTQNQNQEINTATSLGKAIESAIISKLSKSS